MIERARQIAEEKGTYFTNQFYNSDSLKGYEGIGLELLGQVEGPIDVFCGGVGTAGMLVGVAQAFRKANRPTKIVALEPASSAVISTGKAGEHHVEGLGAGFVPPLLDKEYYDEARGIEETEARRMARRLVKLV